MGNHSWMDSPFFSRHLVPQNVGNIICVCYFLNIGLGPTKSQCSRHFSKKSIPGLPYLEPHRKVNATELELRATNFRNFTNNKSELPFTRLPSGSLESRPWRGKIFVGRSRGLPENPWGGKSMENPWKIHGQIQGFWKLRFRQKVKV